MKKQAKDLMEGDNVKIAGKNFVVKNLEFSEIAKQGKRKCRIEAETDEGKKIILIRPEDYPFDTF